MDPHPADRPSPSGEAQAAPPLPDDSVLQAQNSVMVQRKSWRDRAVKVGGGSVAVGGGALKLLGKAALLGKVGLFTLLKFKTLLSMLVSVAAYALFWGWRFAVGFVLLIFVHEVGHVFVLRLQGVKASAPMFLPFFGAWITIEGEQRSVAQEAVSALAGPIAGLLGAAAVFGVGESVDSDLLRALAFTGFLMNLFNLLPALPLDGGRVAGALHPAIWLGGMATAVGLLIWHPSPVFFFVLVYGGIETWRRWRGRKSGQAAQYLSVAPSVRWQIAGAYVLTVAVCLIGMDAAYVPRTF
ncbi:hypothetical protein Cs7R123_44000 [Catellatospora sp. TT07R-123]|uniref:site-2 protease family protein n=1 Tax=Catellatospora sp. TT07R-123 TaxID=2733863 RepID=UPI001B112B24|nr:site-2 protease family protein [Catellatospora sp. TT07R-123]GHJ47058.1 hypothetical protein Cs7R123_44000 [Catellatospora sp. TT07R-123]